LLSSSPPILVANEKSRETCSTGFTAFPKEKRGPGVCRQNPRPVFLPGHGPGYFQGHHHAKEFFSVFCAAFSMEENIVMGGE
jgi:hypothetical protein